MTLIKKWLDDGKYLRFEDLRNERELCREIQAVLISEGFLPRGTNASGLYGPITQNALVNYKRENRLTGGNMLGPTSFAHLLSKQTPPQVANSSSNDLASKVIAVCKARKFPLKNGPNIIGIEGVYPDGRKNADTPDRWNDSIGILDYNEQSGTGRFLCLYLGTTEPGRYYTINPLNSGGAARLQLGYHPAIWSFGLHRGYRALAQTGKATLVRDHNKNFLRDGRVTEEWWRGINLHTTKTTGWRGTYNDFIGQWSAGCVVIKKPNEFQEFLRILERATTQRTNFDFILIWRDWLP